MATPSCSGLLGIAIGGEQRSLPALRALELLPPPRLHASDALASRSRTYVVTNAVAPKGGNLNHPGGTSGLRERRSAFPMQSRVQLVWASDDTLNDEAVASSIRWRGACPTWGDRHPSS